jgi:hypothetical protein
MAQSYGVASHDARPQTNAAHKLLLMGVRKRYKLNLSTHCVRTANIGAGHATVNRITETYANRSNKCGSSTERQLAWKTQTPPPYTDNLEFCVGPEDEGDPTLENVTPAAPSTQILAHSNQREQSPIIGETNNLTLTSSTLPITLPATRQFIQTAATP